MAYIPLCKFDTADVGFDVGAFDSGLLTEVESLNAVDAIITVATKAFMESAACKFDTAEHGFDESVFDIGSPHITDSFLIRLLVSESVNVIDSIQKSVIKLLSEAVNFVDMFTGSVVLKLNEVLRIVDSVIKKHLVKIRKIIIRVRGGSYESDIEVED